MIGELIAKLAQLPFFKRDDLRGLEGKEKNIEMFLYRATQKGEVLRLRRGLYTSRAYIAEAQSKGIYGSYLEFLSNSLVSPSYISSEYVLAKHNLLSEAVTSISSLTTKKGKLITNELASFRYRNIKSPLYNNFLTLSEGPFLIKTASKAKALFDYLYMKKKEWHVIDEKLLLELRLNLESLSFEEWNEIENLVEKARSRKLQSTCKILRRLYAD